MKLKSKWFNGICEGCGVVTHVRALNEHGTFRCEGCQPARTEWFNGLCEDTDCSNSSEVHSIRWTDAGAFLCLNHK